MSTPSARAAWWDGPGIKKHPYFFLKEKVSKRTFAARHSPCSHISFKKQAVQAEKIQVKQSFAIIKCFF
jgi:hypothetical protein